MKARLILGASETCADLLYATRFFAPDAFAWVETGKGTALLISDLEVDRARRDARADRVDSVGELEARLPKTKRRRGFAELLLAWLKEMRVRSITVPGEFPLAVARALEAGGVKVRPAKGAFWPAREVKTPDELKLMRRALRITEAGMARGMEVLSAARAGKNRVLRWGDAVLTAERLRAEIDSAVLRAGGQPGGTIVACGDQACDPHERGTGPLRAGELIILDVFPRDARSGFYGDLTRTVVKGRANDAQKCLWDTCLKGQRMALRVMKPGAAGKEIHESIKAFFADAGYPTEVRDGRWRGFFHGTGHGLGLEIHEEPRFGAAVFKPRNVFTVEPGIYIPGTGGVRHEDVAVITADGCKLLSRFPKRLEIP